MKHAMAVITLCSLIVPAWCLSTRMPGAAVLLNGALS